MQRRKSLFSAMPALAHSSKRQFDTSTRTKAIDEHLPRPNPLRHSNLPSSITRPNRRH